MFKRLFSRLFSTWRIIQEGERAFYVQQWRPIDNLGWGTVSKSLSGYYFWDTKEFGNQFTTKEDAEKFLLKAKASKDYKNTFYY